MDGGRPTKRKLVVPWVNKRQVGCSFILLREKKKKTNPQIIINILNIIIIKSKFIIDGD